MVRCRRLGTEEFWNLGAAVSRDCFGWVGVSFEGSRRYRYRRTIARWTI